MRASVNVCTIRNMHDDGTNGNTNAFAAMVEIMKRALPELHPTEGEKPGAHNKRVAIALAKRWGMEYATFRGLKVGSQGRRPNPIKHSGYFADLRKYERAKFDRRTGRVVPSSLGKGQTVEQYIDSLRA